MLDLLTSPGLTTSKRPITSVSEDLYNKGCVHNLQEAKDASQRIGYPVMIKASEGGGGKGIRKVESENDIGVAYNQVRKRDLLMRNIFNIYIYIKFRRTSQIHYFSLKEVFIYSLIESL